MSVKDHIAIIRKQRMSLRRVIWKQAETTEFAFEYLRSYILKILPCFVSRRGLEKCVSFPISAQNMILFPIKDLVSANFWRIWRFLSLFYYLPSILWQREILVATIFVHLSDRTAGDYFWTSFPVRELRIPSQKSLRAFSQKHNRLLTAILFFVVRPNFFSSKKAHY